MPIGSIFVHSCMTSFQLHDENNENFERYQRYLFPRRGWEKILSQYTNDTIMILVKGEEKNLLECT